MSCAICIDSLITQHESSVARCGHCLHLKCWLECLKNSPTCPICRKPTSLKQLVRVYFNSDEENTVLTLSKKIECLQEKVKSLNGVITSRTEEVNLQQDINQSLRTELTKADDKLAHLGRELHHLRDQLDEGALDREQLYLFRRRFQDHTDLARAVPSGNNKREKLQKLQALIEKEVEKLHSEILTTKYEEASPPATSRSCKNLRTLERKLDKMKELTTTLNERLHKLPHERSLSTNQP